MIVGLTFTSGQDIVVNVVEKVLLLVERLLWHCIINISVTTDEPRAEAVFNEEFPFVHQLFIKLGRVLCHWCWWSRKRAGIDRVWMVNAISNNRWAWLSLVQVWRESSTASVTKETRKWLADLLVNLKRWKSPQSFVRWRWLEALTWKYRPSILIFFDLSLPSLGIAWAGNRRLEVILPLFNFRAGTVDISTALRLDFDWLFTAGWGASWFLLKFCKKRALKPFALLLFWFLLAFSSFVALTITASECLVFSWFSVATLLSASSSSSTSCDTSTFLDFSAWATLLLLWLCSHSWTSVIRFNDWLSLSRVSVCRRRPVLCFR